MGADRIYVITMLSCTLDAQKYDPENYSFMKETREMVATFQHDETRTRPPSPIKPHQCHLQPVRQARTLWEIIRGGNPP